MLFTSNQGLAATVTDAKENSYLFTLNDSSTPFIAGPQFMPAYNTTIPNASLPTNLQLVLGKFFTEKFYATVGWSEFALPTNDFNASTLDNTFKQAAYTALPYKTFLEGSPTQFVTVGIGYTLE